MAWKLVLGSLIFVENQAQALLQMKYLKKDDCIGYVVKIMQTFSGSFLQRIL